MSCTASDRHALIPFAETKHTVEAQAGLRHTCCDADAECPCPPVPTKQVETLQQCVEGWLVAKGIGLLRQRSMLL